ncbi:MAG: class I SAM-dependent methyltransferase [Gemmatimonadales bacterium]
MAKQYDAAYYEYWSRSPRTRVVSDATLAREVALVLGVAEMVLERPVVSVLDVGCGEARWMPVLARARPGIRYQGLDSSRWAVTTWGEQRNIRYGRFGKLGKAGVQGLFDIVLCAGILPYLTDQTLAEGLKELEALCGGVAFLELYVKADSRQARFGGDFAGLKWRSAAKYQRICKAAGWEFLGMQCWAPRRVASTLWTFQYCPHGA